MKRSLAPSSSFKSPFKSPISSSSLSNSNEDENHKKVKTEHVVIRNEVQILSRILPKENFLSHSKSSLDQNLVEQENTSCVEDKTATKSTSISKKIFKSPAQAQAQNIVKSEEED